MLSQSVMMYYKTYSIIKIFVAEVVFFLLFEPKNRIYDSP